MRINLLSQVYKLILSNEEIQRQAASYERAMKTKDWEFLRDIMLTIRGQMAMDIFSKSFTKMTAEEKDISQKVYFHLNEILDFLISPVGWVKKKSTKYPSVSEGINPTQRREGNGR